MKEQSSCQALPLIPTTPRMTDYCHKEYQLLFSSSSSPADARGTDRSPWRARTALPARGPASWGAGDTSAPIHQDWQGWNSISFQLCFLSQDTNLSFWARPAGAVIIRFLLRFSSVPFSTQAIFTENATCDGLGDAFYRNSTNNLQFHMFLHRNTPTIIHRQLCQSGSYGSRPTHLLAWDPLRAGSLWMPFKDTWLSPTL